VHSQMPTGPTALTTKGLQVALQFTYVLTLYHGAQVSSKPYQDRVLRLSISAGKYDG
jgi:hypothetical protein